MAFRLGQPLDYDPFSEEETVDSPSRFSVGDVVEIDPFGDELPETYEAPGPEPRSRNSRRRTSAITPGRTYPLYWVEVRPAWPRRPAWQFPF